MEELPLIGPNVVGHVSTHTPPFIETKYNGSH
jgi:hypothetical protein